MDIEYPNPYEVQSYGGQNNSSLNTSQGSSLNNYSNRDMDQRNNSYNDSSYSRGYSDNYQNQVLGQDYQRSNETVTYQSQDDTDHSPQSSFSSYRSDDSSYDQRDKDRSNRRNRSERRRDRRRDDGDRSRDRDRGPRSRSRERNRDRDRSRDENYDGDFDRRDVDRDRDRMRRGRDRDSRDSREPLVDERAGEKWMTDTPTNTIILRGLPQNIEEKDIRAELVFFGAPIKDVRLMRRSTGASRGFAFVEFQNIDDAQRWTETNQGKLILQNQHACSMHYSTPKNPGDKQMIHKLDWTCSKCGVHNFKRRDFCFKCNISREESGRAQADGFDQIGTNPCNTLLFRGLDALTTEETLLRAINTSLNTSTPLSVKNSQIIRDPVTSTSMGYGFIEMMSVMESMNLLENLKGLNPPLEVDGKLILVSFAKNTFSTTMATLANPAPATSQTWDYSQQQTAATGENYQNYDYSQTYDPATSQYYSQTSGQYYDGQNYDYSSYYQQATGDSSTTVTVSADGGKNSQTDSTNAAAAVALAAIQQAQAVKHYKKQQQKQQKLAEMSSEERLAHQAQEWTQHQGPDGSETTVVKYPPPDVSQYQYDETSGYYYDPTTGLYYDANSTYYYNGNTGQFLYWDAEQSTYLPAPTQDDPSKLDEKAKKEGKDKKEKVKVAKKIAKDMEKWAKTLNAQKEAMKDGMKRITLPNLTGKRPDERESATADAGFAILEKTKTGTGFDDKKLMPPPPPMAGGAGSEAAASSAAGLVASYGGDSDDDDEDQSSGAVDESKLVDLNKMACLLCKRQFQSKDQLIRHQQMSDLHKQNLETLQRQRAASSDTGTQQYRDRAKERREKYGIPGPPEPRKKPPVPEVYEQPTKAGIGQDNIGNKLLQKMGWSEGQGLGRKGQGIVNPIQAQKRSMSAGLGMRGASYGAVDADSYKDAGKKTMFARYHETE